LLKGNVLQVNTTAIVQCAALPDFGYGTQLVTC